MMSKRFTRLIVLAAFGLVLAGSAGFYAMMGGHHGKSGHHHGNGGHDEAKMLGVNGANASDAESDEIRVLFRNFDTITRTVENLPNGIRTVTNSTDRAVMDALVSHVVGMIDRVGQKDDPEIIIQSPTLDIFFMRGDKIRSDVSVEDEGVIVVQTSDDPDIVAALQSHADEVTQMADRGMAAVHEMMEARGQTH